MYPLAFCTVSFLCMAWSKRPCRLPQPGQSWILWSPRRSTSLPGRRAACGWPSGVLCRPNEWLQESLALLGRWGHPHWRDLPISGAHTPGVPLERDPRLHYQKSLSSPGTGSHSPCSSHLQQRGLSCRWSTTLSTLYIYLTAKYKLPILSLQSLSLLIKQYIKTRKIIYSWHEVTTTITTLVISINIEQTGINIES